MRTNTAPVDMADDPAYHEFVESMVKHCRCQNGDVPCDGVLAGGICDDMPDPRDCDDRDHLEIEEEESEKP